MMAMDEKAEQIAALAQYALDHGVFDKETRANLIAIRAEANAIRAALSAAQPVPGVPTDEETVSYILRYGGLCRDCADRDGLCSTGLPCETEDRRAAVRHVLRALSYGQRYGFLHTPQPVEIQREPVAWTGSGSLSAIAAGLEGHIWPSKDAAHPVPLFTTICASEGCGRPADFYKVLKRFADEDGSIREGRLTALSFALAEAASPALSNGERDG